MHFVKSVAIVTSQFNEVITKALNHSAKETLKENGFTAYQVEEFFVPGSFELPLICQTLAQTGKYSSVIALGCVIQGDTPHFDYVCQETSHGLMEAGLKTGVPIIFGVITCNSWEQALIRSGLKDIDPALEIREKKVLNKGHESAQAAIHMMKLMEQIYRKKGI